MQFVVVVFNNARNNLVESHVPCEKAALFRSVDSSFESLGYIADYKKWRISSQESDFATSAVSNMCWQRNKVRNGI